MEDLPLFGRFFLEIFRFPIYFEIFPLFSELYTGYSIIDIADVLLFSTSFVISVLFGDVKTDKIGSFCVTGRSNIATIFEHKNLPLFLPKGGRFKSSFLGLNIAKTKELVFGKGKTGNTPTPIYIDN